MTMNLKFIIANMNVRNEFKIYDLTYLNNTSTFEIHKLEINQFKRNLKSIMENMSSRAV